MNIHEYQAKELLAKFGVPVPQGGVAYTADEAVGVARRIGGSVWVVKAQIHAGGRGKAGGVKLVRSEDEVAAAAKALIGKKLVTHQTGPEGRQVKRVYVEAGCDIARELYLALSIDRATGRITLIAAAEGGVEIEELAARAPEKILRVAIDPAAGFTPFYARRIAFGLGLTGGQMRAMGEFAAALYRAFTELDAALVEINPRVVVAFKLIRSDPNVEAILVNIFGGIMRCDVIAEGIVAAAREVNLHVPLVVRLEGTNVELGRKILGQSGLPLIAAENFEDAAKKVVDVVKEAA